MKYKKKINIATSNYNKVSNLKISVILLERYYRKLRFKIIRLISREEV